MLQVQSGETQGKQYSLEGASFKMEPGIDNVFLVRFRDRTQFRLRASSEEDRKAWLIALKTAVNAGPRLGSASPTISEISAVSPPRGTPPRPMSRTDLTPLARGSNHVRNGSTLHTHTVTDDGGHNSPPSDVGTEYTYASVGSAAMGQSATGAARDAEAGGNSDFSLELPPPLGLQNSNEQIMLSPLTAPQADAQRLHGTQPRNRYGLLHLQTEN